MKRFGVRIAAGAVTILLGALAAAQAQKESAGSGESDWQPPKRSDFQSLPQPITAITSEPREPNSDSFASSKPADLPVADASPAPAFGFPAPAAGSVALASHSEPANANQTAEIGESHPAGQDTAAGSDTSAPDNAPAASSFQMTPPTFGDTGPAETGPAESVSTTIDEPVAATTPTFGFAPVPDNLLQPSEGGLTPDVAIVEETPTVDAASEQLQPAAQPRPGDPPSFAIAPADMHTDAQPAPLPRGEYQLSAETISLPDSPPTFGFAETPDRGASDTLPNDLRATANAGDLRPSQPPAFTAPPTFGEPQQSTSGDLTELSGATMEPAMQMPGSQPRPSLPAGRAVRDVRQEEPPALASYPQPARMASAVPIRETFATPGDHRYEGVQAPSVVIQKRAPAEVKVGKLASFTIQVQNVGSVEALDVQVHDRVPEGMRLVDVSPDPAAYDDGRLVWSLGALPAGGEQTVTMQLMPEREGELGSVARVTFEAAASVRTRSTRPQLKVTQRAPEKVLIGQQCEIEVEISNPGTGRATGVIVQEDVPAQFEHPKGQQLDNALGGLHPGEVRREMLRMRAVEPGLVRNTLRVIGDDGLAAEHTVEIEVIAPSLQLELNGPARRYLERQATYEIDVANAGSAAANNVEIVAQLDRGIQFVSTENHGRYDPTRHAVYWSVEQMRPADAGKIQLTLLPVEEGEQAIRLEARSDLNPAVVSESSVTVESLAELSFQITDSADPIELGSETTYEIRIKNTGSRDDSRVAVQLQFPPGMEVMGTDGGDAEQDNRGNLIFREIPRLDSQQEHVYRVRVRGLKAGPQLIKAIVQSDQSQVRVTKEESTMVYADR